MLDSDTFDPAVGQIAAGIESLAAEDRSGWFGSAMSDRLSDVMALRERLEAETLRLVGEWDRSRAWESDGALSASSWLTFRQPVSRTNARLTVRSARVLDRHERTAKALAAGDISSEHVKCLARVATDLRVDLLAEHEDALLDAAAQLGVDDFGKVTRRWARLADDQLASGTFMEQFERRRLTVSTTFQGTVVGDFALDPDGGAIVLAAVDARSGPDPSSGPDQPRTGPQRRADALVQICRESLGGSDAKEPGRSPVNLNTLVDIDTLLHDDESPSRPASALCDLDGVGPIARETMLRLACDASVCRIVMKGQREILDMGRKTRLVTRAQRRALAIRDAGCQFPGCDRPESWCDAHHVRHWVAHRGPTDLDNLVLLCRRHHVLCHEGGWELSWGDNGQVRVRGPDSRSP